MKRLLSPIVERRYEPDEGACVRAVEILLKSVRKEGGPDNRLKDATKESNNGCGAEHIIPRS